jgi:hypothetical protein
MHVKQFRQKENTKSIGLENIEEFTQKIKEINY